MSSRKWRACSRAATCRTAATGKPSRPLVPDAWPRWKWRSIWKKKGTEPSRHLNGGEHYAIHPPWQLRFDSVADGVWSDDLWGWHRIEAPHGTDVEDSPSGSRQSGWAGTGCRNQHLRHGRCVHRRASGANAGAGARAAAQRRRDLHESGFPDGPRSAAYWWVVPTRRGRGRGESQAASDRLHRPALDSSSRSAHSFGRNSARARQPGAARSGAIRWVFQFQWVAVGQVPGHSAANGLPATD